MPSAPPWHCVYLRPLRNSVCPLYKPFSYHSIFRKNLLLPCYHVLNTLLPCLFLLYLMSSITLLPCLLLPCTMSPITLYHVSHYPVTMSPITLLPCLPLPCYHVSHYPVTMSPITLLPCLLLPCLMSLITLSHVFHYSVIMSLITLSPLRNAKPQKKSWQVNYPKEPYPSKQLTCQLVYLCTPST